MEAYDDLIWQMCIELASFCASCLCEDQKLIGVKLRYTLDPLHFELPGVFFTFLQGHIAHNYTLYGHRDLRATSRSPGKYLYEIIKDWPNYKSTDL